MFRRSFRLTILGLPFSVFLFIVAFGGFSGRALGQQASGSKSSAGQSSEDQGPDHRDNLSWNWNQRGRSVPPGESAVKFRFRAYRQKMAIRAVRAA